MVSKIKLLAVVGPTASGKSELAVSLATSLASEFKCEVVGADAVQFYQEAKIGAAQPSEATKAIVTHHLIGMLKTGMHYSAGQFAHHAHDVIMQLNSEGKFAILCGGSGLYLDALIRGLSPIPAVPASVHNQVLETMQPLSNQQCHALLQAKDPVQAKIINPADRQRIARALAVFLASGIPLSQHQAHPRKPLQAKILAFGFSWKREALYQRIATRAELILAAGLLQETREILKRGGCPSKPPLNAVGYRQAVSCLKGELSPQELPELITRRTCQLAKRQLTWFRHHGFGDPEVPAKYQDKELSLTTHWLDPSQFTCKATTSNGLPENIRSHASNFLRENCK